MRALFQYTGAILKFKTGDHTFTLEARKNKKGYVVFIDQLTDMSDLGEENFKTTYKCACIDSPTEHAAIHFAGKKYLKNWNLQHRIGKDYPLLNN